MVTKRLLFAAIGLGALFGGILLIKLLQAWTQSSKKTARPPSTVSIETVRVVSWARRLRAVGSIVAIQSAAVTTETAGIVKEILFKSGDRVNKDSVLVKLDDAVTNAALAVKIANSKLAKIQFKRARELLPKNAVSRSDYDQAYAKHLAAQAEVKQQEAINEQKIIRASFTGLIGIRKVSQGSYIKAGDAIANLHALNPIYFDYTLPERHFSILNKGMVVQIKMDALSKQIFYGKIEAVEPGIDLGTRTAKIRAILDNPEGKLRPGMFGEAYTVIGEQQQTITVPRTAINFNAYGDFVYIVKPAKSGKTAAANAKLSKRSGPLWITERKAVKTGEMRKGRTAIISGLKPGDQVVIAGLNKLRKSGQKVRVSNHSPLSHQVGTGK